MLLFLVREIQEKMVKVIDDFLPIESFIKLQFDLTANTQFPYYFQNGKDYPLGDKKSEKMLDQFQFCHLFYEDLKENSDWYLSLKELLLKLNASSITRAKVNCNPYNAKLIQGGFHSDCKFKNNKTAVFYLNTCDGYTIFKKDKKKIYSKANRVVIFDSKELHAGTNTTNQKARFVLNINYYEI